MVIWHYDKHSISFFRVLPARGSPCFDIREVNFKEAFYSFPLELAHRRRLCRHRNIAYFSRLPAQDIF